MFICGRQMSSLRHWRWHCKRIAEKSEIFADFIADPHTRQRPDHTEQNAPGAEIIAMTQKCAQPAADKSKNRNAYPNHKLHGLSLAWICGRDYYYIAQ
jgi:hypothetical protein